MNTHTHTHTHTWRGVHTSEVIGFSVEGFLQYLLQEVVSDCLDFVLQDAGRGRDISLEEIRENITVTYTLYAPSNQDCIYTPMVILYLCD